MTPWEFVEKWRDNTQTERASAQSHFNELCELLEEPKPHDVDPKGEWYAFEKGATKANGGNGWADVWKRGAFAWEYKGKHKDLDKALAQVRQYAPALLNPPLLVACDIERIVVTTNWTNTVTATYEITLDDLLKREKRELLKAVFRGDDSLKTGETRAALTQKVAKEFAALAQELESAGHAPLAAAHFVNRLVFCMFAEDAGLLGEHLFTKMLEAAKRHPDRFVEYARRIFAAMSKGGEIDYQPIDWFNGGLFEDDTALPLDRKQIDRVLSAAKLDWSAIDPSIVGTLFERGLDPAKRSQLGAHYTDPDNIMRIVRPVVLDPLEREWEAAKAGIEAAKRPLDKRRRFDAFLARLRGVTVLDPACGSGNFLYLALRGLKDLEHTVLLQAESLGLERQFPQLGPEVLRGIELSPYAAELARVSVWIGELQWQIEHGFNVDRKPVLKPLHTIENKDALIQRFRIVQLPDEPVEDDTEAEGSPSPTPHMRLQGIDLSLDDPSTEGVNYREQSWPEAEFIIGNPPILGDKLMRGELGDDYTDRVRKMYEGRVSGQGDLCVYWFEKARAQIAEGRSKRAGLIATQGIRGGANRRVLQRIKETGDIFFAWSDLDWILEGALVHVSIVGFDDGTQKTRFIDGQPSSDIPSNLTAGTDVTQAKPILQKARAFIGLSMHGPFEIAEQTALQWVELPNPSGKPSSDVLRPIVNAQELGNGSQARWLPLFNQASATEEIALYELPYEFVLSTVKPVREKIVGTFTGNGGGYLANLGRQCFPPLLVSPASSSRQGSPSIVFGDGMALST